MKKTLYIRFLLLAGFSLAVMLVLVGCEDEEVIEEFKPEYFHWYAAGDDVAPLFRAFPLNIDSIYLRLRVHIPLRQRPDSVIYHMFIESYKRSETQPKVITGKEHPSWGAFFDPDTTAFDNVISFRTRNAVENGSDMIITGIYKEFRDNDPHTMKMEYVYERPGWPSAPNAQEGFGSTAEGGYGDNNIHTFTRIIHEEENDE